MDVTEAEIWIDVKGYENIYEISSLGRVLSKRRKKEIILKPRNTWGGYHKVAVWNCYNERRDLFIHRLSMLSFKPTEYFEGAEVNHINGIKTDNRIENLEWVTHQENLQHAARTGLQVHFKRDEHPNSKLNQKMANIIRYSYRKKYLNHKELSKIFNVSEMTIYRVIKNKSWVQHTGV